MEAENQSNPNPSVNFHVILLLPPNYLPATVLNLPAQRIWIKQAMEVQPLSEYH